MKPRILFLLFILTSSASFAQSSDASFYSIDTKSWLTASDRDKYEAELQTAMINDLNIIANADSNKLAECETVKSRLEQDFRTVKTLRKVDQKLKNVLNSDILAVLKDGTYSINPPKVDSQQFCIPELGECANIYVDDYWRCREWMSPKIREEIQISPLDPDFIRYNFSQLSKAYISKIFLIEQLETYVDLLNSSRNESDQIAATAIKEQIGKLSDLTTNGYLFYSLDGHECKTKSERDSRNAFLYETVKEELNRMDVNGAVDKDTIERLRDVFFAVSTQIEKLQYMVDWWASFGDYDNTYRYMTNIYPEVGFGLYQSKNKETFYIKEMADAYNCLFDSYNLGNGIIDEINLASKESGNNDSDNLATINSDLEKLIDVDGEKISILFKQYFEGRDKMDAKFNIVEW